MMMRSGRIRRLLISSWRWRIAPWPSTLGGRVSRRTMFSCASCSSAASSMVTMRSSCGMYCDRMFKKVVLPAPVPPEIRMLMRARTAAASISIISGGDALQLHQLIGGQRAGAEAADGQRGPIERQRRNDGVDARTIGQARIDHRRGFIDSAADTRHDAVDDLQQMAVVAEHRIDLLQDAACAR